jgi:hypothetical protein
MFLAEIVVINERLRQLSYTNLVSNYTNHVVLMSFLSTVDQYAYITRHVSPAVAYWTHMLGVMGSNPGRIKTFFFL